MRLTKRDTLQERLERILARDETQAWVATIAPNSMPYSPVEILRGAPRSGEPTREALPEAGLTPNAIHTLRQSAANLAAEARA